MKRLDRFPQNDFRPESLSVHGLWSTQVSMKPVRSGVGEARLASLQELPPQTGEDPEENLEAADELFEQEIEMTRNVSIVLFIVVLIAVVVSVDILFFRNRFWERLMANIGIVLVFAAFYLRFLNNR